MKKQLKLKPHRHQRARSCAHKMRRSLRAMGPRGEPGGSGGAERPQGTGTRRGRRERPGGTGGVRAYTKMVGQTLPIVVYEHTSKHRRCTRVRENEWPTATPVHVRAQAATPQNQKARARQQGPRPGRPGRGPTDQGAAEGRPGRGPRGSNRGEASRGPGAAKGHGKRCQADTLPFNLPSARVAEPTARAWVCPRCLEARRDIYIYIYPANLPELECASLQLQCSNLQSPNTFQS